MYKRQDVGFYSGARKLLEVLCQDREDNTEIEIQCGISSVVYFMSQIGLSWDDAKIVSAHGRGCNPVSYTHLYLACGDTGAGKMPEPETLLAYIEREAACEKDLKGKKILVTAGPTQESVDPVRYLTNHSSGKMGYAIAKAAMLRGADVTLVSGRTSIEPPMFVNLIPVVTARAMYEAVTSVSNEQDIIIKAAAVADYRPARISEEKVKKSDGQMSIELELSLIHI